MRIDAGWEGTWKDLAARLADAAVGTPLAYESRDGEVKVNPRPDERIVARAVFALISGEPAQALDRAAAALGKGV